MEVKSSLNYYRIAPRKIRLVADLIRGKQIDQAQISLSFLPKRATQPILKLLNSAISNAKNNLNVKEEDINNFYIKTILINEGPKLKRWRPVSRGTAHEIQKKTSHVVLVLSEKQKPKKTENRKKAEKKEKKVKGEKKIKNIKKES